MLNSKERKRRLFSKDASGRRNLLKLLKPFTVWAAGAYMGLDLISLLSASSLANRGGERLDFSTSGADYTFLGQRHGIPLDDKTQVASEALDPSLLPDNYDAVVFEYADPYLEYQDAKDAFHFVSSAKFTRDITYDASRRGVDFLFVDLPIRSEITQLLIDAPISLIATYFGLDAVRKIIDKRENLATLDSFKA